MAFNTAKNCAWIFYKTFSTSCKIAFPRAYILCVWEFCVSAKMWELFKASVFWLEIVQENTSVITVILYYLLAMFLYLLCFQVFSPDWYAQENKSSNLGFTDEMFMWVRWVQQKGYWMDKYFFVESLWSVQYLPNHISLNEKKLY